VINQFCVLLTGPLVLRSTGPNNGEVPQALRRPL